MQNFLFEWHLLLVTSLRNLSKLSNILNGQDNCHWEMEDCDHEGHSGWRLRDMIENIHWILPEGSSGPQPDIVLLLLGTNGTVWFLIII